MKRGKKKYGFDTQFRKTIHQLPGKYDHPVQDCWFIGP